MPLVRTLYVRMLAAALALPLAPAPLSAAQNLDLLSGRLFPASQSDAGVVATATGDFNGDGKPDLITVTDGLQEDTSISILLGVGDGSFNPPVTINTGPLLVFPALEVGDFNGDGHLDFVILPGESSTISVFLGNGDGTFQAPIATTVASPPTLGGGIVVGDFNGDHKADIALTANAPQQGEGTILVLLSNGDGTFKTPVSYPTTLYPHFIVAGDFNGDGKLDLAATTNNADVLALLGNGDGTFGKENDSPFPLSCSYNQALDPYVLVPGDFNGDGKEDLALNAVVMLSNGDGTFQPMCNQVYLASVASDFNNDGILDLAAIASSLPGSVGGPSAIYLGKGDGTFQEVSSFQSSLSTYNYFEVPPVAAADFDGNGTIDLAGLGNGNNVTVLQGNGDGTFRTLSAITQYPLDFIAGDLRSDGKTDLILFGGAPNFAVTVLLGNGNGTFQNPVQYDPENPSFFGMLGDFNHDGKPDLAAIGEIGAPRPFPQLYILLGNGDGTFQNATIYSFSDSIPNFLKALGIADFNGDGNQDIVVPGQIFLGNGDGTFGFPVTINAGVAPMVVGDVNGDGKPDIVEPGNNSIAACLNNGNLTFTCIDTPIAGALVDLTLADFNHDGKPDLAVALASPPGGIQVLLGNGDGTFQSKGVVASGITVSSVTVADLNGDGIPDLAFSDFGLSVLLGNGDGTFQPAVTFDAGPLGTPNSPISSVVAADFNGDGKIDLAATDGVGIALLFNTVGIVQSIGLGIPPGGSNSATVNAGSTAHYTLSIGGGGMSGTAKLTCTGAPTGATCALPGSENVSTNQPSNFTVSVSTTARNSAALQHEGSSLGFFWATLLVGLVYVPLGVRRRRRMRALGTLSFLALMCLIASCGGGGSSGNSGGSSGGSSAGTPAGTYTLTVTATMGSTQQSQTLKLTVN